MDRFRIVLLLGVLTMVAACRSADVRPAIPPVPQVDVARFMGDWYVIAHIPTYAERDAHAAVESYALRPDGRIQTTFRFRKGALDGPHKTLHPVGTVKEGSGGAVWDMQFVWPIQAEYVIVYLDEDYQQTIVGRSKRDYVWLMARTPRIPQAEYDAHLQRIGKLGYDVARIRKVPQPP